MSARSAPMVRHCGFSLVELMVSITLGLMLMAGLISVMLSVSNASRVSVGTARLQENARYALAELAARLRSSSELACMSFTGAGILDTGADQAMEPFRTTTVRFDATQPPLSLGMGTPTADYPIDAAAFMRGFECVPGGDCDPNPASFGALAGGVLPPIGNAPGDRARGSDVLYVRGLSGDSARIEALLNHEQDGLPARVQLSTAASDIGMTAGSATALISDCSTQLIANVVPQGNELVLSGNFQNETLPDLAMSGQARAYNLDGDDATAIYYVQVRSADTESGPRTITSLVRSNGSQEVVIADGVERFDLLYHVQDSSGRVAVLDAGGVDAFPATSCRPASTPDPLLAATSGPCGWRSVIGIELHMLVNSVESVDVRSDAEPYYYPWDGQGNPVAPGTFLMPGDAALPSGLLPGRELRSHFSTFVSLRSRNP